MATSNETIVIIGAGVTGLSNALYIQEHLRPSQSILLIATHFPHHTSINYASPWAGAHYRPVPGSSPQLVREECQARRTYTFFKALAASDPASGVQALEGIEHLESPPDEYLDDTLVANSYGHLDEFQLLDPPELPEGVKWGARYKSFVVNSPVYCAWMLRRFILRGGVVREYTLADIMEAFQVAPNVKTAVNCSGMGFGDPKSFPIRGQTCLVRNPCSATITRQNADGTWSFCIPRPLDGGTIIGGTKQPHDWTPTPRPETRKTLLDNAAKWFPFTPESGGRFDLIRDIVGRRPAREGGMRIEIEDLAPGKTVVHAYGAGGRGYELSRGVAEDVVLLMLERGLLRERQASL
ncbi:hypothetical protein ASPZODRAFT_318834 [Penicilliopsis zonata CBS 506.65]|uniref:FAD dependent oxidoreductase domain-containing protein n=1 Tax=Penicilliopsis zonata CBS 506.65 TaxID=1073090 RepID=A0A1L9SVF7_9EURO|nr:hypothetical protein ASPZODRAFT_318834 [Penicilliopsis zonata CBS 506.65]OJJ51101.1 hypothetical protein ASPZODRAFT_318834 [Penicilliopsis zonata CBS 506.65]